ncbi:CDP-alcohol phosphatidyltransferase family protein [Pedobacter nototheniae]|uniref:CDP-alcohol phosphatidyltransferase family protein n=1 Tax=Pedobacter nototheniae TaxID=2488994 RepID=UPI00103A2F30|nr:CDP-alcohol phosphatidyltransferase family protein [Pedobacter nototheniae]
MNLPQILILSRFLSAPIIIASAYFMGESSKILIVVLMYIGLLTDIFDGIIARKQNISTEKLRRLDSQTDLIFWLSIAVATWILRADILKDNLTGIWIILMMEALCYVISLIKFKKETCTHSIISKIWGITLLIAFTGLIGFNQAGFTFYLTLIVGLISHLDVILIILILPEWKHDIPSFYHAIQIRKGKEIKRNKLFNG